MFKLMFIAVFKYDSQHKKNIKKIEDAYNDQLNIIADNAALIKKYYKDDCLALKKEHGLDIDKYNYF